MNPIHAWGIQLIALLQGAAPWLRGPMAFFSFLGTEEFFLVLLPFVYWCVDAALGARVGIILCLSTSVNDLCKFAFHDPRPYWISSRVQALANETSYGLPSGHAQNATAIWGLVGAAGRGLVRWLAVAVIFMIGLSRVFLAVHFPSDVLAGWLIGAVVLWAFMRWERPVLVWVNRHTLTEKIALGLVASMVLIVVPFLGLLLAPASDPAMWLENAARAFPPEPGTLAINPQDTTGFVGVAGVFFGLAAGLALLAEQGGFHAGGVWWKRLARFALGAAGVLVLWLGLRMVLPRDASLVAQVLRYLRYALTGFWVAYIAPWVFLRIKLCERLPAMPRQPAVEAAPELGLR